MSAALFLMFPAELQAQERGAVTLDAQGVLRWTATGQEVALFGVNYSTPFAHAYRAHARLDVDRKQAIDADVLHLARLGLDAYRIHVWDREVSDRDGNLLDNEHLDLFDYLLAQLAAHGIRVILTPIAWWPSGYPEPDPGTSGLSDGWTKGEMTTSPIARRAQVNYLRQFVEHRNRYSGHTYGGDPNVLAIEIFNEPAHPGLPEETTRYIDTLVGALREAGFAKPIFYNISQDYNDAHGRAVCAADIQGVSHQWYPTGLVRGAAAGGNMLPNVERYTIPYDTFPGCANKARMVYEFDAADVAGSYMYPAMARSFRAAGFQWATQFAYDPLAMAHVNTEYQTHYLNLVYTPGRAISFMIAGEVFRGTARGAVFGRHPESDRFGPFRVSYDEDLSEMVDDTVFLYSNDTRTPAPSPARLRRVAGVGSSPVVTYAGTGAYFLDRLADGVWRLEVYPDVAWVVDPFTRPSLEREAARVIWRTRKMRIALPDLGEVFSVEPVNAGNTHRPAVQAGATVDVRPGVYVLARAGAARPAAWTGETVVAGRALGAFTAPASSDGASIVLHDPATERAADVAFSVRVDVVSRGPADSVVLFVRGDGGQSRPLRVRMAASDGFAYEVVVPAERVHEGLLEYAVTVFEAGTSRTFPRGVPGDPLRWDFTGAFWRVPIVRAGGALLLFDARRDLEHMLHPHPWQYVPFTTGTVPGSEPGAFAVRAVVQDLTPSPHHFALRTFLPAAQRTRLAEASDTWVLRIRARSAGDAAGRMQVALVERDGAAWGVEIELTGAWQEVRVPLSALRPVPLALLPRPYPQFLPYLRESLPTASGPRPGALDGVQFAIAAGMFQNTGRAGPHGFEIERIVLEPAR